jgi:hypothetical protein
MEEKKTAVGAMRDSILNTGKLRQKFYSYDFSRALPARPSVKRGLDVRYILAK